MATTYLGNAFALSMLPADGSLFAVGVQRVTPALARVFLTKDGFVSIVGHESTANVLATMLDLPVYTNRISVNLEADDTLVVAQYNGPRLAEGATTLPEGATIDFMVVCPGVVSKGVPFTV